MTPISHNHRKLYPQIYGLKPGPVQVLHMPKLQYVAQDMVTDFHMDWAGHPEPLDEPWLGHCQGRESAKTTSQGVNSLQVQVNAARNHLAWPP